MSNTEAQLKDRLKHTRQVIKDISSTYNRQQSEIQLLAVSKTRAADELRTAFNLGQTAFGENYCQEALDKQQQLLDLDIEWHFIGPIQSNKTRDISTHFNWVHSVDRLKIAKRLSDQRPPELPPLNICLQVNIDREASKSGIAPEDIISLANEIMQLPKINLRGLMVIPAPRDSFEEQFETFKRVRDIMQTIPTMDTLSMGMSGDMEAAIAAGSTIVRVGTAIFGERAAKKQN
jgi:pyridoxal phosphate enzyme (YggS family)